MKEHKSLNIINISLTALAPFNMLPLLISIAYSSFKCSMPICEL